jgi:hypothetical protein
VLNLVRTCAVVSLAVALVSPLAVAQKTKEEVKAASNKPKSQRWQVSWGVDPDARKVDATPVKTTIARLLKFKRPKDLPGKGTIPNKYKTKRIKGVETVVWTVSGTVINVAYERDGDYRLILADEKGNELTCVLVDPKRAPKRGRFSSRIEGARAIVVRTFHPTLTPREVRTPATLTGFGYFGKFNSDANKSPEGFQLHPVFKVKFGKR